MFLSVNGTAQSYGVRLFAESEDDPTVVPNLRDHLAHQESDLVHQFSLLRLWRHSGTVSVCGITPLPLTP